MARDGGRLGFRWPVLVGLAALMVPRAVLHDAGVDMGPILLLVVNLGPLAVWVWAAVARRVPAPVLTLVLVGLLYGVALGVVHNVMWESVFEDGEPALGGALRGELSDGAEETFLRASVAFSSVLTGAVVGLIAGLVAAALLRSTRRR